VCVCWPDGCKYFLFRLTWLSAKKFWVVHDFFPFFFSTCTLQVVRPSTTRAYSVSKLFLFFAFRLDEAVCGKSVWLRNWLDLQCRDEPLRNGQWLEKEKRSWTTFLEAAAAAERGEKHPFTPTSLSPTLCTRLILVTWKMFKAFSNCPY
jgi:hypothetical protein